MRDGIEQDTITACPRCSSENPGPPHSFLEYDELKSDIVICPKCGEIPKSEVSKGPRFGITRFEIP